jgi:pimeloyl-ACP methyl ester carboxylesterase
MMRALIAALLIFLALPVHAATNGLVTIDTRPGVTVSLYAMRQAGATSTVVLLTGGAGGIGMKQGVPTSNNFLVRSRDLFVANGFNVAIVGKPSDKDELDGTFRTSAEHLEDLKRVVAHLKKETGLPIWVVGTSMGTISATALAIASGTSDISGIVLTSSVTNRKPGAVPTQRLEAIRLPVLVLHHEWDACKICVPGEVPQIIRGLKHAPITKEVYVKGGANPTGNPCEALHWHGFIGMEKEAVDLISAWIRNPTP